MNLGVAGALGRQLQRADVARIEEALREFRRQPGSVRDCVAHRRDLPQLRRDKSGSLHLSHVVDPATGRYRDRQVLTLETPAA